MDDDRITFGMYQGFKFIDIPDPYLCWIVKTYKGGFKARHAGERPLFFTISEDTFIKAKKILNDRGWNTKGIDPVKD